MLSASTKLLKVLYPSIGEVQEQCEGTDDGAQRAIRSEGAFIAPCRGNLTWLSFLRLFDSHPTDVIIHKFNFSSLSYRYFGTNSYFLDSRQNVSTFKSNGGIFIVLSDRHDNNMRLIKRQFAYVHYRKVGSWQ